MSISLRQESAIDSINIDESLLIKKCPKCGLWKSLDKFSPKSKTNRRPRSYCKACINKSVLDYREKKKKTDPAWYQKELERFRVKNKQARKPLTKEQKRKLAIRRAKNKKEQYQNDPLFRLQAKARSKAYREANKEKERIRHKKYYYEKLKTDPEKWAKTLAQQRYYSRYNNYKPRKYCPSCGDYFPLTTEHFMQQTTSPDGYFGICITCSNDKEKLNEYMISLTDQESTK